MRIGHLTRRSFLIAGLSTASAVILAACAQKAEPTAAPVAQPTPPPTKVAPTVAPPTVQPTASPVKAEPTAPPVAQPTVPPTVVEPTAQPAEVKPTPPPTEAQPTATSDPFPDVANGEGALITVDGAKVAVYRDDAGQVIMLSPKCPHAGCDVEWNAAEKRWGCPCHASLFEPDGTLIKGPASQGLKPIG